MVIPTLGPVRFIDLQNEFGGTSPIRMSEYYRLGPNVPATGRVSLSNFRGAYDTFFATLSANALNLDLFSYLTSIGWNAFSKVQLTISPGVYVYSNSTSTAALSINNFPRQVTILNSGFIMGQGGNGGYALRTEGTYNGQPGGPAIQMNSAVPLIIQNLPTGYIGGGGGGGASSPWTGGGGGAGGGIGGTSSNFGNNSLVQQGGAGGAPGQVGANGGGARPGAGGGAGGGGGSWAAVKGGSSGDQTGGGGGGGRIFPGVGGAGSGGTGTGGSANSPGAVGTGAAGFETGGGGGGWGAVGGNSGTRIGGAGGKAVNILNGSVSVIQGAERIYGAIS